MTKRRHVVVTGLAALAAAVGTVAAALPAAGPAAAATEVPVDGAPADPWMQWAAVLLAGDHSIAAFDNGVDALGAELSDRGVHVVETLRATDGTATRAGLSAAMAELAATNARGCLVYLTSHGNEQGLYLSLEGYTMLSPVELDSLIDTGCGDRPTAIVVSACHSGTFVPALSAPNRVVITAARTDRTSFGCSADAVYTFFDQCVLGALPAVDGWEQLYGSARACVEQREAALGYTPSEPQVAVGAVMTGAALPVNFLAWLMEGVTAA
jgi:hypothetical protein